MAVLAKISAFPLELPCVLFGTQRFMARSTVAKHAKQMATVRYLFGAEVMAYFRSLLEDVSPIPSRNNLGMTA